MYKGLTWFGAIWMAVASAGAAQADPVVVELFTSQGCSSCPPADELLTQLSKRDDVLPLALHIDYWDYIGWKDGFAHAAFTARQKAYARAGGRAMIYTPQMIVGGKEDVVGNRPMDVTDLISKHLDRDDPVSLSLTREGGTLQIAASSDARVRPSDLYLVRYEPEKTVDILHGENAGKRLTYTNIVTEWHRLGQWDGIGQLDLSVPVEGASPVVVLVQEVGHGPILAAGRVD